MMRDFICRYWEKDKSVLVADSSLNNQYCTRDRGFIESLSMNGMISEIHAGPVFRLANDYPWTQLCIPFLDLLLKTLLTKVRIVWKEVPPPWGGLCIDSNEAFGLGRTHNYLVSTWTPSRNC